MSNIFPTKTQLSLSNVDNTSDINKPVSTAQGIAIASASVIQIASATGVDGNALASTNLTFGAGISLATHVPIFYIIKFGSGTIGICAVKMKTSLADLTAIAPILTVTSTQEAAISNSALASFPNSGNITIEVTTGSVGASTFSVFAYGIARP